MWYLKSEHKSVGVKAKSYRSEHGQINANFDLGIFFGSYESRGLYSSRCLNENSCQNSIIIYFSELDEKGLRVEYDKVLYQQVERCSFNKPNTIKDKSINDFEYIVEKILELGNMSRGKRDCSWFVDTTTTPKPYYLMILAKFRDSISNPKLTFFNATGHYEKNQKGPEVYSFTEGFEEYMWMPGFWGQPDPRLPWTYFFFLGFEGDRSYGTYDRFEPRYVKALIADPGYRPNYCEIAIEKNRQFIENAFPDIVNADAADAVEAWKKIDECINKIPFDTNICIVPLGTKPHAIAGGLSAITNWNFALLYVKPKGHKVRDIAKGDFVWKYEIRI